jgi:hypothetical protein
MSKFKNPDNICLFLARCTDRSHLTQIKVLNWMKILITEMIKSNEYEINMGNWKSVKGKLQISPDKIVE